MNFWEVHGIFFLMIITIFPRLTLIFSGIAWGFGCFSWIGLVFLPRLTIAILATTYYWDTNPILCILAWIIALGGTAGECKVAQKASGK